MKAVENLNEVELKAAAILDKLKQKVGFEYCCQYSVFDSVTYTGLKRWIASRFGDEIEEDELPSWVFKYGDPCWSYTREFEKYRLDFLIERESVKIDLEVDGKKYHEGREEYDKRRDQFMQQRGYKVIRIPAKIFYCGNSFALKYIGKRLCKAFGFNSIMTRRVLRLCEDAGQSSLDIVWPGA